MSEFAEQLDYVYVVVKEYKGTIPVISILVPSENNEEEPMDFVEKYQLYQAFPQTRTMPSRYFSLVWFVVWKNSYEGTFAPRTLL